MGTPKLYTDIDMVKDTFTEILIRFAVKLGPTRMQLYWESDTRDYQIVPAEYLYNQLNSMSTPFMFTVNPGISNSTMSGLLNNDYKTALVGITETLTIIARDRYGNKQVH